MSHINVIIAAGGSSLRYGNENKLLEPCGASCVLVEAIKPFLSFPEVKKVIREKADPTEARASAPKNLPTIRVSAIL